MITPPLPFRCKVTGHPQNGAAYRYVAWGPGLERNRPWSQDTVAVTVVDGTPAPDIASGVWSREMTVEEFKAIDADPHISIEVLS